MLILNITTAIKNMIDNAIKYSTNKHVNIIVNKNTIKLHDGKPLDNSIEYYLKLLRKVIMPQKLWFGVMHSRYTKALE